MSSLLRRDETIGFSDNSPLQPAEKVELTTAERVAHVCSMMKTISSEAKQLALLGGVLQRDPDTEEELANAFPHLIAKLDRVTA